MTDLDKLSQLAVEKEKFALIKEISAPRILRNDSELITPIFRKQI